MAIDGDTIVAGAPTDDGGGRGAAYTFARTGAVARTETAKLTASDSQGLRLGSSVAIAGDTIVAGAPGTNLGQGSAYTFARTGAAARTETAKLTASDAATNASLGSSVAIDTAAIVAGTPGDGVGVNRSQGAAYTFTRTGAPARTETAKLTAADRAPGDQLGTRSRPTPARSSPAPPATTSARTPTRAPPQFSSRPCPLRPLPRRLRLRRLRPLRLR